MEKINFNDMVHYIWLFWIFMWLLSILFISDAQKKDYQVYDYFEMRYPKAFPIFFNVLFGFGFIVFGILFILSKNKSLQDIIMFICILSGLLASMLLNHLYFKRSKLIITNKGIKSEYLVKKSLFMSWSDITTIELLSGKRGFSLKAGSQAIAITPDLRGINILLLHIKRKLPQEFYENCLEELEYFASLRKSLQ